MRFVDEVVLEVEAGDGGNGAVAFRREKFRPRGGPSGGDGGRGGDVVFVASRNLMTLLDFRSRPRIKAKRGQDGRGNDCHGRGAEDLELSLPVGTVIHDARTSELIGDLIADGQRLVVAKGGAGGRGNMRFATPANRAPRRADPGVPGEARRLRLELKLLADVGLLGLPNVGKSTLVAHLSAARPKVADYPFTTLAPNLGVVSVGEGGSFVVADIPGIIRGAASGAGLGVRFLRHVQRTAILLHVLAPTDAGDRDLWADFEDLSAEVLEFDPDLAARPRLVALNKADLPSARALEPELRRELAARGLELVLISAVTGEGLDALKHRLAAMIARSREAAPEPG